MVKNPRDNAGDVPRSLGQEDPCKGNGNLLHYSCLGNPMDRSTLGGRSTNSPGRDSGQKVGHWKEESKKDH